MTGTEPGVNSEAELIVKTLTVQLLPTLPKNHVNGLIFKGKTAPQQLIF